MLGFSYGLAPGFHIRDVLDALGGAGVVLGAREGAVFVLGFHVAVQDDFSKIIGLDNNRVRR